MITLYVPLGDAGKRYVGITNDLDRRLKEHTSGRTKGGQILDPFKLLHTEEFVDYSSARVRKKYLKAGQGREWLDGLQASRTRPASGG